MSEIVLSTVDSEVPSDPASVTAVRGQGRRGPSEPAEQPKPRCSLAADASPEEIERHFLGRGGDPPRLTSTATAVERWQAVRTAHHEGVLPISGNWVDLVSVLHHHGFLPHLPSDRATRAALVILAKLSPLVRRLQHRRWVLGGAQVG